MLAADKRAKASKRVGFIVQVSVFKATTNQALDVSTKEGCFRLGTTPMTVCLFTSMKTLINESS